MPRNGMAKVRLSDGELDIIDAVRQTVPRGTWVREAALHVARKGMWGRLPHLPARKRGGGRTPVAFRMNVREGKIIDDCREQSPRDQWVRSAALKYALGIQKGTCHDVVQRKFPAGEATGSAEPFPGAPDEVDVPEVSELEVTEQAETVPNVAAVTSDAPPAASTVAETVNGPAEPPRALEPPPAVEVEAQPPAA